MWLLEGSFGGSMLKPCRDAPALDEPPSVGILFLSSPGWPLICALTGGFEACAAQSHLETSSVHPHSHRPNIPDLAKL